MSKSLCALIAALSFAQSGAADDRAGYLVSALDASPVSTAHGGCVQTREWTPEMSYRECVKLRLSMDMLFDFGAATLGPDAVPDLDELAKHLAAAEHLKVDIVGHADRIGGAKYNQRLSMQRAKAVADYLATRGVEPSRIAVYGAGSAAPVSGSECDGMQGKDLVWCLQPDRYAEVTVLR